jgi:Cohesin domain
VTRVGVFVISILLTGILITLALPNFPAVAQDGNTILRFAPQALWLKPDAQGTLNVRVDNVQGLYGLEFQLVFDPDIIKVIDADPDKEGVQIKPADWWRDGFVAVNRVDNDNGRIEFAATLLRPALAVNGNRVVATIPFAARKTGMSSLNVESATLSTRNAEAIPYTQQAGEIGVNESGQVPQVQSGTLSAVPEAGRLALAGGALLAFITALGGFIFVLRRRK